MKSMAAAATSSSSSCAACKYQRKKCTKDCPLARYFPPEDPQSSIHAYRLFSSSNLIKIPNQVQPHHQRVVDESMDSYYPVLEAKILALRQQKQRLQQLEQTITNSLAALVLAEQHQQQQKKSSDDDSMMLNNFDPDLEEVSLEDWLQMQNEQYSSQELHIPSANNNGVTNVNADVSGDAKSSSEIIESWLVQQGHPNHYEDDNKAPFLE